MAFESLYEGAKVVGTVTATIAGVIKLGQETAKGVKWLKNRKAKRAASRKKHGWRFWLGLTFALLTLVSWGFLMRYAFGAPSVRLIQWTLVTIALFMITTALDEDPLDKGDLLGAMCLLVVLTSASLGLTFSVFQATLPKKVPTSAPTSASSVPSETGS